MTETATETSSTETVATSSMEATDAGVSVTETTEEGGVEASFSTLDDKPVEQDPLERIKEKYSNDIDKMAEAYRNAEIKISEGQYDAPVAPDEYAYNFNVEGLEADMIKSDDPLLNKMETIFRDNNVTQDLADNLVNGFLEYEMEQQTTAEDEIAKLGSDGEAILERLTNYSLSNLEEGERAAFDAMTANAEQVRVLHKMIESMGEQPLAPQNVAQESAKTSQEYMDEAFEYRAKHADSISWNKGQQAHYEGLIKKAGNAKK